MRLARHMQTISATTVRSIHPSRLNLSVSAVLRPKHCDTDQYPCQQRNQNDHRQCRQTEIEHGIHQATSYNSSMSIREVFRAWCYTFIRPRCCVLYLTITSIFLSTEGEHSHKRRSEER